jgi:diguanylate cyclase (GGDEF)-like protein/PAS domain S-box-containing protein
VHKIGLNVLYVEDDAITREALLEFLTEVTKKVYTAEDGKKALKIYEKENIDVLITDIKMPEMNGFELIKKIREKDRDIPVIVTTAYDEVDYLVECIELGVNHFLLKPIETDKLYEILKKIVENLSMQKNLVHLAYLLAEYKNAIDVSTILIKVDTKGNITYVNKEFENISQYKLEELEGLPFLDLLYPASYNVEEITDYFTLSMKDVWKGEIKLKEKDGSPFYVKLTIVPITGEEKQIIEYVLIAHDISELVNKKEELTRQLYIDPSTGLPNRRKLFEDAEKVENPSLILINVDSFREFNDFYGNDVGDYIIKEIAKRIYLVLPDEHWRLYKLQADEYAVLITKKVSVLDIERFLVVIEEEINNKSFFFNDNEIEISVSMGIAVWENVIKSKNKWRELIIKADMALKRAKRLNKNFIFYNDSFQIVKEYEKNIYWAKQIRKAIKEDRIITFYQPIVNNLNHKIEKYESLVRLIDEEGNIVLPSNFLEVSKKSKLYPYITRIVLERCLNTFKNTDLSVSVNISILDILDPETYQFIERKLKENFHMAGRLVFEIVESEGVENYAYVKNFADMVKSLGCKIALDDFGSGYSNFSHIMELNVDFLKIDSSLIRDIHIDRNAELIVQTIVTFSKWLGIKTIAEYVHSKEVFDKILQLGIDYSQGFYFGEPKPKIKLRDVEK